MIIKIIFPSSSPSPTHFSFKSTFWCSHWKQSMCGTMNYYSNILKVSLLFNQTHAQVIKYSSFTKSPFPRDPTSPSSHYQRNVKESVARHQDGLVWERDLFFHFQTARERLFLPFPSTERESHTTWIVWVAARVTWGEERFCLVYNFLLVSQNLAVSVGTSRYG